MKIKKKIALCLGILAINLAILMPNITKTSISDLLVTKSYASDDLKELEKQVQDARLKRDQAKKDYEESVKDTKNVLNFFEWVKFNYPSDANDIDSAISVLNAHPQNTNYKDPKDASSMENIKRSLEILKDSNKKRTSDKNFKNLNPLYTSHRMLAIAISNANNSYRASLGHLRHFKVSENLSWGSDDPNAGWYTRELSIYNRNPNEKFAKVGHYLNIVNKKHFVTGLALNKKALNKYGSTWSQVFDFAGKDTNYYTIDQYFELINNYESTIRANNLEKNYKEAEENYKNLKEKLEKLKINLEKPKVEPEKPKVEPEKPKVEPEKSIEEQIRDTIERLKIKLTGINYIKREMPESVKRYQDRIDQASERAKRSLQQAEEYLESLIS